MSKSATLACTVTLQGDAFNPAAVLNAGANVPVNNNAPGPVTQPLAASANTITVPSGLTLNYALIIPPANSVNTKTYKGVTGDTGFVGTFQPVMVPVTAGGSFVILSTSTETVLIVYG